jgi:hypothetical protein
VYATIMEGALKGYWSFADPDKQKQLLDDYQKTRGGFAPASKSAAVANQ